MEAPALRDPARPRKASGLLILDVDGVLFRSHLIVRLARRRSLACSVQTLTEGLLFETGRMTLEVFLKRCYSRLRGLSWEDVWATYRAMPLTGRIAETVRAFRRAGWRVVFLTSGVPDPIVKDFARRMEADDGLGVHVGVSGGRLTGAVTGALTTEHGKLEAVQRLMAEEGLGWSDVTVVGDDRNNLPLLRRAGVSVGFRATSAVRREARLLVEGESLRAIVHPALAARRAPGEPQRALRRRWHSEVLRKVVHMTGAAVPLLAVWSPALLMLALATATVGYVTLEFFRLNGWHIPGVSRLWRLVMRRHERRHLAMGPLTLALGVSVALACTPAEVAFPAILIAVVADSFAAVVGQRWGAVRWPHNPRKTLEGSLAFLAGAFFCAAAYLPAPQAGCMALVAAALESLPIQDWDNFVTPVGSAMLMGAALGA